MRGRLVAHMIFIMVSGCKFFHQEKRHAVFQTGPCVAVLICCYFNKIFCRAPDFEMSFQWNIKGDKKHREGMNMIYEPELFELDAMKRMEASP